MTKAQEATVQAVMRKHIEKAIEELGDEELGYWGENAVDRIALIAAEAVAVQAETFEYLDRNGMLKESKQ
jgi:hypothetical protein